MEVLGPYLGCMLLEGQPQRVHVGIWYILRAQRGSHIPTLRPKYIPYAYMDPLGESQQSSCRFVCRGGGVGTLGYRSAHFVVP